ncbi:hypothetical protein [Saccharopolyspora endophytica]|uniref:Transcriptional regulator n=1 Tax=Saccharopolyspora endophytica TaxID=543886 RepID=A0ABS5DK22_9PSEU|nr:hypothetical protein [Saccharopolyspora endophytica]MBQ0926637.1 hypothetical protein [Saccharopolyspora endophytica]
MTTVAPAVNPALAEQIPLVRRPKPLGLPLEKRIAELTALTDWPAGADHHQQVARASGVINVAALIASDIGLAHLAEDLCWRLHTIFAEPRDVTPDVAVMALMPLTNIARLLIREGKPTEAYELLQQLYHAARHREVATIRGQDIDLSAWTHTREHHRRICTELWSTVLIDGARALARAGCWTHAAETIAAHRGIGNRLLDGRQIKIMALLEQDHRSQATALIDSTIPSETWETAVGQLLRLSCRQGSSTDRRDQVDSAVDTTLALMNDTEPSTTAFRVRLGVTTLDLAGDLSTKTITQLRQTVVSAALSDAYAAREAMRNQTLCAQLTTEQKHQLTAVLAVSGLDQRTMSAGQDQDITTAVHHAEEHLRTLIRHR